MRGVDNRPGWLDVARYKAVLFCALSVALSAPALANDTEAALGVGGLVFQASKSIEMLSEELFVSEEQIVVDYRFRNVSKADTTSLVAFPLPEIKFDPDNPEPRYVDHLEFATFVDGVPVKIDIERKAMLRGRDETATLQRYSVPLDPIEAADFLQKADQKLTSTLEALALVDDNGNPAWGFKITYYWKQMFPRGKEVWVEHRYRPILGGSVGTGLGRPDSHDFYSRFCVDEAFLRAASAASKGRPFGTENYLEYVLTTGANWLGPIKKFRLVVDKGSEDNLVSFCGEGVRKISPTQFEMTASNFTPRGNLAILIFQPAKHVKEAPNEDQDVGLATLSCDALWHRRNSIFKAAGYCFKSKRAISQFGNAGCRFDNPDLVPLGDADRKLVDAILAFEQAKRCQQ